MTFELIPLEGINHNRKKIKLHYNLKNKRQLKKLLMHIFSLNSLCSTSLAGRFHDLVAKSC